MPIINLDQGVINALQFFSEHKIKKLNTNGFSFPFVIGSGNAYNTGRIIFSKQTAVFSDESTFREKLEAYKSLIKKKLIQEAVVISASGEKDAPWEIKLAKQNKLKTTLLTCSPTSSGAKIADKVIVYDKIAEPYTYNISTYLGMILSVSKESPNNILKTIEKINFPTNFSSYNAFTFIIPNDYSDLIPMLDIKKSELFGSKLSLRSFTYGNARHAKFVIPNKKELVISLGDNKYYGDKNNRWKIKTSNKYQPALVMALTYYIIGKIQESKPAYFKKNITHYCQEGPKAYGHKKPFEVIVK